MVKEKSLEMNFKIYQLTKHDQLIESCLLKSLKIRKINELDKLIRI